MGRGWLFAISLFALTIVGAPTALGDDNGPLSPAQIALFESNHPKSIQEAEWLEYRFLREAGSVAVAAAMLSPTNIAADAQPAAPRSDYPTSARADYVLGCMAANGNTREALFQCSCAIDTIAGLLPYGDYEKAETALSLQTGGGVGGRVGLFRDPPEIKAVLERLREAQAEANLTCFR